MLIHSKNLVRTVFYAENCCTYINFGCISLKLYLFVVTFFTTFSVVSFIAKKHPSFVTRVRCKTGTVLGNIAIYFSHQNSVSEYFQTIKCRNANRLKQNLADICKNEVKPIAK